jgi:hypothetical protein
MSSPAPGPGETVHGQREEPHLLTRLPLTARNSSASREGDISGNAVREEVLRILHGKVRSSKDLINTVSNLETGAAFRTPGLHHGPDEFWDVLALTALTACVALVCHLLSVVIGRLRCDVLALTALTACVALVCHLLCVVIARLRLDVLALAALTAEKQVRCACLPSACNVLGRSSALHDIGCALLPPALRRPGGLAARCVAL